MIAEEIALLFADHASNGDRVDEEILAEPVTGGNFRTLHSPGFGQGVAAGDIIEVRGSRSLRVLERGGNLCIQIFTRAELRALEAAAIEKLAILGAQLDGKHEAKAASELVFTVPLAAGFTAVEAALADLARAPDTSWYCGNVRDPHDGVTPLGWWETE
jgi:hypothetical protein